MLAAKIAFVRQFPLPYDEGFHFGLIRLYAHHLNPFLSGQPQGADAYGAVARDPSYLYHYLMSFPYRLIALVIPGETGQVIALRCLNIALGLTTLYLVYRLAKRCGLSDIGAGLVSLALAVTPVFYDLAAQINYDNLLLPLALLSVLSAINVTDQFRRRQVPLVQVSLLTSLILLASIVKYSYLPIGLAIAGYVAMVALRNLGFGVFARIGQVFSTLRPLTKVMLVMLVVISSGLWAQRYVVNMAEYHTPHPQCHAVLSVAACSNYSPWARNYQLHADRDTRPLPSRPIITFTNFWVKTVSMELYAIVHAYPTYVSYAPVGGLMVISAMVVTIGGLAVVFFFKEFRRSMPMWTLLVLVSALYLTTLYGQNFSDYRNLHDFVAIQGRYLLPVIPLVYIGIAVSYGVAAKSLFNFEKEKLYAILLGLVVVGWLGLRQLRHIGQLALGRVVNFDWGQLVQHSDNPVSEFAADPWIGDSTPSFR